MAGPRFGALLPAAGSHQANGPVGGRHLDLAGCMGAALLAPFFMAVLPGGSLLRAVLLGVTLLVVPGYLLMQAVEPAAGRARRAVHAAIALGVSPALVGLAALSTALLPGGFQAERIILVEVLLMVALGAVAWRRRMSAQPVLEAPDAGIPPAGIPPAAVAPVPSRPVDPMPVAPTPVAPAPGAPAPIVLAPAAHDPVAPGPLGHSEPVVPDSPVVPGASGRTQA